MSTTANRPVKEAAASNAPEGNSEGSLTMTLRGNMTLNLQYDFDGQAVQIGFTDGALKVQLPDGTEFKIPVHGRRGNNLRRVA